MVVKTDSELASLRARQVDINAHLAKFLSKQRAGVSAHAVHGPLYEDVCEFATRPGKRVRPLLFMLATDAFGGSSDISYTAKLAVGASMELLHAFILIHDDLIDQSETRRGQPTLHRVIERRLHGFGDRARPAANLALVMGDILNALAHACLLEAEMDAELKLRLLQKLLSYIVETGYGETADIVYGLRDISKVSPGEIEQMYHGKTTRYTIECPLVLAGVCCGFSEELLQELTSISEPAGLAFQIQNDLQEFERFEISDSEVPADVLEGKKTVLMREAFERLSETDQGLLQLCLSNERPSETTVSKIRELVVKSGAFGHLQRRMEALFLEAERRVVESGLDKSARAQLIASFGFVRSALGGRHSADVRKTPKAGKKKAAQSL